MIKLIIFDLDGVLFDSKDMHYQCLNKALAKVSPEYLINYEEHLSKFDGLPTKEKLKILSEQGLDQNLHSEICYLKQQETIKYLQKNINQSNKLIEIFSFLKEHNYKICVASNAVSSTIRLCLDRLGIKKFVNTI